MLARGVALIAGFVAAMSLAAPAPAEAASAAECELSGGLGFNSGIDFSPNANRWQTEGARISCRGELGGRAATGAPGFFYAEAGYRLETQCGSEDGWGSLTASVPVVFGRVAIHGDFTYSRAGGVITIKGAPRLREEGPWGPGADEKVRLRGDLKIEYRTGGCAAVHREGAQLGGPATVNSIGGGPAGGAADPERCVPSEGGTPGPDRINGSGASDWLEGLAGDDRLRGLGGADCLFGGDGADRLVGGGGGDDLAPGRGRDRINAGAGDDRINAADGSRDLIRCGPGRDRVRADAWDLLHGCEVVRHV